MILLLYHNTTMIKYNNATSIHFCEEAKTMNLARASSRRRQKKAKPPRQSAGSNTPSRLGQVTPLIT